MCCFLPLSFLPSSLPLPVPSLSPLPPLTLLPCSLLPSVSSPSSLSSFPLPQDTSYSFSAPKNCSTKPVVATLQPYTKLHLPPKAPPTQAVKQPPPLKNMSVVDALRQPKFQPAPLASSKNSNVIDLTSDEEVCGNYCGQEGHLRFNHVLSDSDVLSDWTVC